MTLRRTHRDRSLNSPGYMPIDDSTMAEFFEVVNIRFAGA